MIGITYFLLPPDQRIASSTESFFRSFAANPTIQMSHYWAWAMGAVFALAAVPAISEVVRPINEGWVRWATTLAQLGFAVTAISYFTILAVQPERAASYVCTQCQETVIKPALVANQNLLGLDPQGWLTFGAVGLWILVVNLLALRGGTLPRPLAYIGIALGIFYGAAVAATALRLQVLAPILFAFVGIFLAPIWYIWIGLRLRSSQLSAHDARSSEPRSNY